MRFYSLASSSKANCYVLEHDGKGLLIDAGLGKRKMLRMMDAAGISEVKYQAILLSHHHADHAGHAWKISAALHFPVYCSEGTFEQAPASLEKKAETFAAGEDLDIPPFHINSVVTYHTPGAVGFRVTAGGRHAAVFTDVAALPGPVVAVLETSHFIGIEADYDEAMLEACSYDPELKWRIRLAHTSNEQLVEMFSNGFRSETLHTAVLLHTSKVANLPFIAQDKVGKALRKCFADREITVDVAGADGFCGPFEV